MSIIADVTREYFAPVTATWRWLKVRGLIVPACLLFLALLAIYMIILSVAP